jgi:hypothetical protein
MLLNTCNIEATRMHGFERAILLSAENVCTHPEIITGSPNIMMEQPTMRTVGKPIFMKLFAEINDMARVAIDQKTRLSPKSRYGGLKASSFERSRNNVTKIDATRATTGVRAKYLKFIFSPQ